MAEFGETVRGATSYVLSPKGKPTESKSKIKPAPIELNEADPAKEKQKDREKDQEREEIIVSLTRKGTKLGHRRIDEDGQITYKKQPSSALVSAIQLGIQYSVGRLSSKVERDVLMGDFYEIESVFFPSDGRQETPAHHYSDFRFKAYAPVAFRYFRELFHIAPDDFLISLCHEVLRELTNPGASGSLFYLSMDDQFIIKTVQHKEAEFLQKLLPGYYLNLNQNKRTLLPKFFGLYCYQCGGKNIRLVVMNNLLPSGYKIHLKYDLKGSTFKRKASKAERAKSSPTLKDLDFMKNHPEGISLDAETYNVLTKTIQRDCRVLESFKIMDYSLLLAIHNIDEAARDKTEARGEPSSTAGTKPTSAVPTTNNSNEDRTASEKSTNELAKGVQASAGVSRQPSARNRDDFSAYWEAIPQHRDDNATPYGAIRARNVKGDRLLLFIGIIDILQSYRLKKRLEHRLKSVVQDGDSISVHRPSFYAKRFQAFMSEKVFRKIPAGRPQITRSPSKKRASFNTGKSRERIRTSSDTDKHGHKSGGNNKSLASKQTLSPSLDAGLANAVPGDVSFMGRETKSLEAVPNPTTSGASADTKSDNLPNDSEESSKIPDDTPNNLRLSSATDDMAEASENGRLESVPSQETGTDDLPIIPVEKRTDDTPNNSDDTPNHPGTSSATDDNPEMSKGPASLSREETETNNVLNSEEMSNKLDDTPNNADETPHNPGPSSATDGIGETSENERRESLTLEETKTDDLPNTSEESSRTSDNAPNNREPSSTHDATVSGRADSSSDSEPSVLDSRV